MAKNKSAEAPVSETAIVGAGDAELAVSTGGLDLAAMAKDFEDSGAKVANPDLFYYAPLDGNGNINPIRGIILERRSRPDDSGFYYVIGLTHPCQLKNEDGDFFLAPKGSYAWVDERYRLRCLAEHQPVMVKQEGIDVIAAYSECLVIPTEQVKLKKGGKTMWKFKVLIMKVNPATPGLPTTAPIATPQQLPPPVDDTDIPF